MAIRPVDMQVVMPRASEVIKTDANLAIRPDVKSQETAELVQKQVQAAQQQILRKNEAQKNSINKDRESGQGQQGQKKKKDEEEVLIELGDKVVKPPKINELGSRFDVSL